MSVPPIRPPSLSGKPWPLVCGIDRLKRWRTVSTSGALRSLHEAVGGDRNNGYMQLSELVSVSAAVASTRSRTAKTAAIAEALSHATPDEVETVVAYLSGQLRQRRTGLGWQGLSDVPAPADSPQLSVQDVHEVFEEISTLSGGGARAKRARLVHDLFASATADEQRFLRGLVAGDLRQGALDGIMLDAVARATSLPPVAVRRAVMMGGETGPVALAALTEGSRGLQRFVLEPGRPVRPMLAATAPDIRSAVAKVAPTEAQVAVDWKLDGIRIQVHRRGDDVLIATRSLDDITDRVPEVVEAVRELPATTLVLDGEALGLTPEGRPLPFQQTAARTMSSTGVARLREQVPLTTFLFDLLHLDGRDLIDEPAAVRLAIMRDALPAHLVVPRLLTADVPEAEAFFEAAISQGHEGVVVKGLTAAYEAGRRGASWVKVKPRHTLDLVVLAAEWGNGRRQGWLSNLHLGARDPAGGFVMLGKTFKGLTDALLTWQTERLLALETRRDRHIVWVRPELVVEIAFDGLQTSSRYPGGLALRFARVIRYREDKTPAEADTIGTVRSLMPT
jgi:DNA ligase 1